MKCYNYYTCQLLPNLYPIVLKNIEFWKNEKEEEVSTCCEGISDKEKSGVLDDYLFDPNIDDE